ncbi:hypothetical protein JQN73_13635 [Glaciimonas sp. PAMC28666]|nr:hypothetical protein JQN73_13635 [Glaciimonas sp. PAMC28666]
MNNNGTMHTFDDIEIRRPELATSYLSLLLAQPGRPIALFAPRRVGKTYFLDGDLTPAAEKMGFLAVYADLWLNRTFPLDAINQALEEALDDVNVPLSRLGKIGKTKVKRVGALGASLELGAAPRRRSLPEKPELRMDSLIARLAADSDKPILLMLDEIQALGHSAGGEAAIATVRAVLQKHKKKLVAVFTGSSQEALGEMMMSAGGPMYQFAQLLTFPFLDIEFLERLASHFRKVHPTKTLDIDALQKVFAHIGFKPALMKDIVKEMSAEGMTDVNLALAHFMQDERNFLAWQSVFSGLQPLEQAVLIILAHGIAPMGKETISVLAAVPTVKATLAKVRAALDRMRKAGILANPPKIGYMIEDRLFRDYIAKTYIPNYIAAGKLIQTSST